MSNIISESSTRIKTGIALVVGLLIIGLINSFTLTWFLFGGLMLVALKEAMNLFKLNDDKIYVYALVIWIIAYFYPKPEDLIFVLAIIFASI